MDFPRGVLSTPPLPLSYFCALCFFSTSPLCTFLNASRASNSHSHAQTRGGAARGEGPLQVYVTGSLLLCGDLMHHLLSFSPNEL